MHPPTLRHIPFFAVIPLVLFIVWDSPWASGTALFLTGLLLLLYKPRGEETAEAPHPSPAAGQTARAFEQGG